MCSSPQHLAFPLQGCFPGQQRLRAASGLRPVRAQAQHATAAGRSSRLSSAAPAPDPCWPAITLPTRCVFVWVWGSRFLLKRAACWVLFFHTSMVVWRVQCLMLCWHPWCLSCRGDRRRCWAAPAKPRRARQASWALPMPWRPCPMAPASLWPTQITIAYSTCGSMARFAQSGARQAQVREACYASSKVLKCARQACLGRAMRCLRWSL